MIVIFCLITAILLNLCLGMYFLLSFKLLIYKIVKNNCKKIVNLPLTLTFTCEAQSTCLPGYTEVSGAKKCIFISTTQATSFSAAVQNCTTNTNFSGGGLVEVRDNATKNYIQANAVSGKMKFSFKTNIIQSGSGAIIV